MASSNSLLFFSAVLLLASPASASQYYQLGIIGATGPESIVFDNAGGGPYVGVSDGRVLRWNTPTNQWVEFAAAPNRRREVCDGSHNPNLEAQCGRPLGLQFNRVTGELYIADAYKGLLVVGPRGGTATPVVVSVEGQPLRLTDGLDINQANGIVYFTDASAVYTRKDNGLIVATGDRTGRLMSYNPITRQVRVLLRGLAFPNGVALSGDGSFLLVAETSNLRIMRYWLAGPRVRSYEVFAYVPGYPDNVRRNTRGEFWVGVAKGWASSSPAAGTTVGMKFNAEGQILQVIGEREVGNIVSVSEVQESNGVLWIGSVDVPFVGVYRPF